MSEKKQKVNLVFEEKLAQSTEKEKSRRETSDSNEEERNQTNNKNYNSSSSNFKNTSRFKISAKNSSHMTENNKNFNSTNPRLLGMSEHLSTNSLRNSSYIWSFGKSDRFYAGLYKTALSDSIYNIPDRKSGRATSQGFSNKYDLKPLQGRDSPSPNLYNIKSFADLNIEKKKGFYISRKSNNISAKSSLFPGPGTYDVLKSFDPNRKNLITLKSRTMFFYDEDLAKQKHCISPQKYFPSTKIVENMRYTQIGFGFGSRPQQSNKFNFPGPGTYNLPSVFDLNRKNKTTLN